MFFDMILTEENEVKAEYLKNSVKSYLRQVALSRKKDMSETIEKRLASALEDVIMRETSDKLDEFMEQVRERLNIDQ